MARAKRQPHYERVDVAAPNGFALWGLVSHMAREGWEACGLLTQEGGLCVIPLRRLAR